MKRESIPQIVYVSTYPPRECGIATFTSDLVNNFDKIFSPSVRTKIAAMGSERNIHTYPKKVFLRINSESRESYEQAAREINSLAAVKLVNIQHEFGIFGGEWGSNLRFLLNGLNKPVVVTLHTVLPNPDNRVKAEVVFIAQKAAALVVMTQLSKKILLDDYGIAEDLVYVIPHGIHAMEFSTPDRGKKKLGLGGHTIISTFGLLSSNKGIEYVLESLPTVVKKYPDLLYLVLGKTHPEILKREGETYRRFLETKIKDLGLAGHVRFYNRYLKLPELLAFLKATDIYVSTSLDLNQAVSGTFSYALGTGRPVISTAFAQARADITSDNGILVGVRDPQGYAQALLRLLEQGTLRENMGQAAYFRTRHMTWQNVSLSYMKLFSKLVPGLMRANMHLPKIKLAHMAALTDNFGIFQFAKLNVADAEYGYTLDDNARALSVAALYYNVYKKPPALRLVKTYLRFIAHALQPSGVFQNYFNRQRQLDKAANSKDNLEEANARALLALARVAALERMPEAVRKQACEIYDARMGAKTVFTFARAIALYIKSLCFRYEHARNQEILSEIAMLCDQMLEHYQKNGSPEWKWFEREFTYSNSILCEALLWGYKVTGNELYFTVGKECLDFLVEQTFINGLYIPIGQNGWYIQGLKRAYFDQQPEDAAAMVQTLMVMHEITQDEHYRKLMYKAFNWFLGDNYLGQFIYDCSTGGCYDGLGEKNVNLNQGAESTVSYLLARLSLEDDKKPAN